MTCITRRPVLLPAIVLALVSTVCAASAQDSNRGFLDNIFGGSERVSPSAPPQQGMNGQAPGSDMLMRLDRLEAQVRQLTGTVEQLQYRNQQLEAELHGGQRGGTSAVRPQSQQQARPGGYQQQPTYQQPGYEAPAQAPAETGRRSDAFDPSQHPDAPGAPHALGSTASSGPPPQQPVSEDVGHEAGTPLDLSTLSGSAASDPSLAPGGRPSRGPDPRGSSPANRQVATLPPSDSPKDNFDLAYGYMLRRDYGQAESSFRAFLEKFPNDRLTPDAEYWLGESLFQRQQYREAAEAFLTVSTKYETTPKAPESLLRLGQSLAGLGEKEAACASLGEVSRKYPRASVAVKQGVEREQKRAHC